MTLRISEIYLSVQGEGPRVGEPTVFVRFGGCNLRCAGWPCDTPHAIFPETYRHEWEKRSVVEVYNAIADEAAGRLVNICYTGGEPFLQPHGNLQELTVALQGPLWVRDIECFSNGTIEYPNWATSYINFIMDWKVKGSGEDPFNPTRLKNLEKFNVTQAVKFVIKDREDYEQAKFLWETEIQNKSPVEVFYGVAWGHLENSQLVEWVLEDGLPWRLNVQVHNHIWDRTKRGI